LLYWLHRNKSEEYPVKLNNLITNAINLLAEYTHPRTCTDFQDVYVKIVKDYKIFFKEDSSTIYIISVWDTRQNPDKLPIQKK
jgi:toxin YoeB